MPTQENTYSYIYREIRISCLDQKIFTEMLNSTQYIIFQLIITYISKMCKDGQNIDTGMLGMHPQRTRKSSMRKGIVQNVIFFSQFLDKATRCIQFFREIRVPTGIPHKIIIPPIFTSTCKCCLLKNSRCEKKVLIVSNYCCFGFLYLW